MAHFNTHISVFSRLSRSWGMTEEGWEFWSWTSRQYVWCYLCRLIPPNSAYYITRFRLLADLLISQPLRESVLSSISTKDSSVASEMEGELNSNSRQRGESAQEKDQGLNLATYLSHPGC